MIWEQEGYVDPTVEEMSGREDTIVTVVTLPLVKKDRSQNQSLSEKGTEKGTDQRVKKSAEIGERVEKVKGKKAVDVKSWFVHMCFLKCVTRR